MLSHELILSKSTPYEPEHGSLVERCIRNERAAQEELYRKYYGKMMGLCRRYFSGQDEAMEVLNHGFLKVFQNINRFSGSGSFEAWIYRIIHNTAMDYLKANMKNRQLSIEDNSLAEEVPVPAECLEKLQNTDLLKLLDYLPAASRAVFSLYAVEGYKHAEIASLLNISEGTSKWHLNHARTRLKALIEQNL